MAESVQILLEQMIPEFEKWKKKKIFTDAEIKRIIKKRTQFEYKIRSRNPNKVDSLRYIAYELHLLKLVKQRCIEMGVNKKKHILIGFVVRRLHFLFDRTLLKFPGDEKILLQYFDFCANNKANKAMDRVLGRAVAFHPTNENLWVMAANWHYQRNQDFKTARTLLQRGLRINESSQVLWLQYFRLEMLYRETVMERLLMLEKPLSSSSGATSSTSSGTTIIYIISFSFLWSYHCPNLSVSLYFLSAALV